MDSFAIYAHVPFCRRRCRYCDFVSTVMSDPPVEAYVTALESEWKARAIAFSGRRLTSLYVGGGTPSVLEETAIGRIVALAREWPAAEITVEANPGDADEDWYRRLADAGVNRFSIGVQAMDDSRLAWLGRRHDVAQARRAIAAALASGASSVNADLIWGTPGQREEDLVAEVERLADTGVHHVSAYELTVSPDTPLGREAAARDLGLPGEDEAADLWFAVGERLAALGFERYEVSNHARPGHECRHNVHTWMGGTYAGLGAGAHGFGVAGGRFERYANSPSVAEYLQGRVERPLSGVGRGAFSETVPPASHARELVMLGLRTSRGVDFDAVLALADAGLVERWRFVARDLITTGLARFDGGRLVPTPRSMMLADGIAARFFDVE